MQVAVDGPASAGKSTVAKIIAKKLSFVYIDTGAMYRACTVIARNHDLDYGDEAGILKAIDEDGIELRSENGEQKVYVAGKDVSKEIRTPEISANVSQVSALPKIREKMVSLQRQMAGKTNVIMDGRDIGTNILPDADVKIYLTASVETRAKRRYNELKEKGEDCDLEQIAQDIKERDERDMNRDTAPLKKAEDAILVDSSDMTIPEVVSEICSHCR